MKRRKKKMIGLVCYLLFTLACVILWFETDIRTELLFCVWYLGTVWYWLMLWIRVIELLGKKKRMKRKIEKVRK